MPLFEEKLIKLVRQNSFLFDLTNVDYRKRRDTWEVIARELNSDARKCRQRWRSLRDGYRRRIKSGDESQKKWKYYEQLSFLNNYIHDAQYRKFDGIEDEDVEVCDVGIPFYNSHDVYNGDEYSTMSASAQQHSMLEPAKDIVTYEIVELPDSPVMPTHDPCPPPTTTTTSTAVTKKAKKRRHKDDPVEREFIMRLNETADQMRTKPEIRSSTRKLLDSLATKIEDAQLPLAVLNKLEVDLLKLVHTALENNV